MTGTQNEVGKEGERKFTPTTEEEEERRRRGGGGKEGRILSTTVTG